MIATITRSSGLTVGVAVAVAPRCAPPILAFCDKSSATLTLGHARERWRPGGAVVGAGGGAVQGHQRTQLVHLGCDYEV